MGAGVLPFSVVGDELRFLFQTVFAGRKTGFLNDFGGGVGDGESPRECAVREFIEETETMYFAEDPMRATRTAESVGAQMPLVEALFEATLSDHPDWWCRRAPGDSRKPKDWTTYFIEVPHRDVVPLNRAWKDDPTGRYKKRRELIWLTVDELLSIYAADPQRLWKRVRQLEGAPDLIQRIRQVKAG